jgi:hypothetical protein
MLPSFRCSLLGHIWMLMQSGSESESSCLWFHVTTQVHLNALYTLNFSMVNTVWDIGHITYYFIVCSKVHCHLTFMTWSSKWLSPTGSDTFLVFAMYARVLNPLISSVKLSYYLCSTRYSLESWQLLSQSVTKPEDLSPCLQKSTIGSCYEPV